MKIEHLALWVHDLEKMRDFYTRYFQAQAGELYHNPTKQFHSYFLSFETGPRLEIMTRPDIAETRSQPPQQVMGLTHFAISLGSQAQVDQLTETLRADGYSVVGEPRTTGDGYYESVVLDPEGNYLELTV